MSSKSVKSKQESSCAYRLNRAALMRMEEGKRKAMTLVDKYYDNRAVCYQLERRRSSNIHPSRSRSRSQSQSQNEESRSGDESPPSEATVSIRTILQRHKTRKKENSSITAYTPKMNTSIKSKGLISTDKKLRSGHKRKPSNARYKEPGFEVQGLNVRRISTEDSHKRRSKTKRRPHTKRSGSTLRQSSSEPREKRPLRQQTEHSTIPIRQIQQGADMPPESNTVRNQPYVTWAVSPEPHVLKRDNKQNNEEEITNTKSDLSDSIKVEPLAAEKEPKPGSPLSNSVLKGTSFLNPKNPFDDSFFFKKLKLSDELRKSSEGPKKISPVDVSREASILVSHESVDKQSKGRRGGKRTGVVRPGSASRKILLKPLVSNVTVTSDQEEVISKWRKRLGTTSPPSKVLPYIPSSSLRDSQVLTVQGTQPDNEAYFNPTTTDYLIPEKDSADFSIDNAEFRKSLKSMSGKHSDEVFSAREEKELYMRMEIEKTKKHIHYLEELAREKIRKLETIRWKKKRALEEEAQLNEKLEKLFHRIQELRQSDSYARLLDKQTQVFSTRKNRPNIK